MRGPGRGPREGLVMGAGARSRQQGGSSGRLLKGQREWLAAGYGDGGRAGSGGGGGPTMEYGALTASPTACVLRALHTFALR